MSVRSSARARRTLPQQARYQSACRSIGPHGAWDCHQAREVAALIAAPQNPRTGVSTQATQAKRNLEKALEPRT